MPDDTQRTPDHAHHPHGDGRISADRAARLMDPMRLETQLSENDLARLLALHGDEDVADLGSGAGFYTDRMAALTTGTVYALDIQPEMHEFYRSRGIPGNVRLVIGDVNRLGFPPASLDVACSVATWHETDGAIDFAGLARALRPGGRLVIVDWRKEPQVEEGGPPLDIRFSKEEVAASLPPYFRLVSAEDLGPSMFAVVAVRADLSAE
jgi:SAM-dependent methyltransferase